MEPGIIIKSEMFNQPATIIIERKKYSIERFLCVYFYYNLS